MNETEARDALARWRQASGQRDDLIRAAREAGITKYEIHQLTGVARTTINRILNQEQQMTHTTELHCRDHQGAAMTTIYLYEDNGGGLHIQKDDGPIWDLGVCGAIYGPDAGAFAADAKAWLDGSWEPNEGDGQHTYGDTKPAEGDKLIAVYRSKDGLAFPGWENPGFSGQAYLGIIVTGTPAGQS